MIPFVQRLATASITAALALLLASSAHAQEARKLDVAETATIAAVDVGESTVYLETPAGADSAIRTDESTRVIQGGKDVALSSLAVGDRVVVEARTGIEGGPVIADRIVVVIDSPEDSR